VASLRLHPNRSPCSRRDNTRLLSYHFRHHRLLLNLRLHLRFRFPNHLQHWHLERCMRSSLLDRAYPVIRIDPFIFTLTAPILRWNQEIIILEVYAFQGSELSSVLNKPFSDIFFALIPQEQNPLTSDYACSSGFVKFGNGTRPHRFCYRSQHNGRLI